MQGQEKKIIDYFSLLKKYNRVACSYLFIGEDPAVVFEIIKVINCNRSDYPCETCIDCLKINMRKHPDIFFINPQNNTIRIDEIRKAQKFLSFKSFQAQKKAIIINYAHQLTPEAANAFLKTLEEPPASSFIALISQRNDLILPTVASRCRKIYIPLKKQESFVSCEELLDFLGGKDVYISDRHHLSLFLLGLISIIRDYLAFNIYKSTNKLINKDNYEIISKLNYTFQDAKDKLEGILKIYTAVENVNLNLALNLLRLKFS